MNLHGGKTSSQEKDKTGLFIFHRDFRIVDNIGLLELSKKCSTIYPIFIFTPEQVDRNPYKSNNSIIFMIESLISLDEQIKQMSGGQLLTFYGKNDMVIREIIQKYNIDCIGFNRDYTPYAKSRDQSIINICEEHEVEVVIGEDYYLHIPGSIMNSTGNPYQKFTPYYLVAKSKKVESPERSKRIQFSIGNNIKKYTFPLSNAMDKLCKPNLNILVHGGKTNGSIILKTAIRNAGEYKNIHDILSENTTHLSPYIKFGIFSIRQIYSSFSGNTEIIRQLIWRDFYAQVLHFYPDVLEGPMKPAYKHINWHHNMKWFNAWKIGNTGFPVVDASMRELNTTGFCHNRGRLIVASFLVKTLLINWQEGEKYFARMLTDYDPASNNLNWQWCASSGIDSQPYFRIFNPWEQGKHYDPECIYIKKWIPELKDVSAKDIHQWDVKFVDYKNEIKYPKPICDYKIQKELALKMYSDIYK
jgi:deoxyribodipyrimidine photo-lyase